MTWGHCTVRDDVYQASCLANLHRIDACVAIGDIEESTPLPPGFDGSLELLRAAVSIELPDTAHCVLVIR